MELDPFIIDGKITTAAFEAAYAYRDSKNNSLHLPSKKWLKKADTNKDGVWTVDELKAWKGYEGQVICRNFWDQHYGCTPRCLGGLYKMDGDPIAFEDSNVKLDGDTYHDFRDDALDGPIMANSYKGSLTPAQRIVIQDVVRSNIARRLDGTFVHIGIKSIDAWMDIFDAFKCPPMDTPVWELPKGALSCTYKNQSYQGLAVKTLEEIPHGATDEERHQILQDHLMQSMMPRTYNKSVPDVCIFKDQIRDVYGTVSPVDTTITNCTLEAIDNVKKNAPNTEEVHCRLPNSTLIRCEVTHGMYRSIKWCHMEGTPIPQQGLQLPCSSDTAELHLYESFTGFGKCNIEKDTGMCPLAGTSAVRREALEKELRIKTNSTSRIEIHRQVFRKFTTADFTKKISLAVIDVPLYDTLMIVLKAIAPQLTRRATVLIHDYGWEGYPGVELATNDFVNSVKKPQMKLELPGKDKAAACYMAKLTVQ